MSVNKNDYDLLLFVEHINIQQEQTQRMYYHALNMLNDSEIAFRPDIIESIFHRCIMELAEIDEFYKLPQGGQRITERYLYSITSNHCRWQFRFSAKELLLLSRLLDIPDPFVTSNSYIFTPVEALVLLCVRLRSPGTIDFLTTLFDRSETAISEVVDELAIHLHTRWNHLFDFPYDSLLSPQNLKLYADAIYNRGASAPSVWGFIGSTVHHVCRQSTYRRELHNSLKQFHAQKFQVVTLPNGLIGHLSGPYEGRDHDSFLFVESELHEKCLEHAIQPGSNPDSPVQDRYFQLYGDPVYGLSQVVLSPFEGNETTREQLAWNAAMETVGNEVEHIFDIMGTTWPFLTAFLELKAQSSPVGAYYTCFNGNQISTTFQCPPPSVESYLV